MAFDPIRHDYYIPVNPCYYKLWNSCDTIDDLQSEIEDIVGADCWGLTSERKGQRRVCFNDYENNRNPPTFSHSKFSLKSERPDVVNIYMFEENGYRLRIDFSWEAPKPTFTVMAFCSEHCLEILKGTEKLPDLKNGYAQQCTIQKEKGYYDVTAHNEETAEVIWNLADQVCRRSRTPDKLCMRFSHVYPGSWFLIFLERWLRSQDSEFQ